MYNIFISSEFKKWIRDPLMSFMLFYPILFGILGRYFMPWLADKNGFSLDLYADLIVVVLTLLTPQLFGALIGFSILDDRDDKILTSIKITPLSIHQFLSFRMVMGLVLTFITCIYVIWFSNIGNLSTSNILVISALASLATPMTALLINSLANNKIEGFAVMKGVGIILVFPIVALFFMNSKELIFAFAPGFWPAKAISSIIRGNELMYMSYNMYVGVGFVYVILLNYLVYKVFLRRIKI